MARRNSSIDSVFPFEKFCTRRRLGLIGGSWDAPERLQVVKRSFLDGQRSWSDGRGGREKMLETDLVLLIYSTSWSTM